MLGGISSHLIAPHEEFYFFDVTTEHLWTISIRAIYLGNTRIDNCGKAILFLFLRYNKMLRINRFRNFIHFIQQLPYGYFLLEIWCLLAMHTS